MSPHAPPHFLNPVSSYFITQALKDIVEVPLLLEVPPVLEAVQDLTVNVCPSSSMAPGPAAGLDNPSLALNLPRRCYEESFCCLLGMASGTEQAFNAHLVTH